MDTHRRGQSPYGFRWQGGRLVVEEAEAKVRRLAADLFLRHRSMGAVARELDAAGHLTRRGGKWSDVQAARILECPSAIGKYEIGRSEADASGTRRKTAKGARETVECEPILTRDIWERLTAAIAQGRAKRAGDDEAKAPASGLVWCACGERMRKPPGSARYKCPTCPVLIEEADLEAIFAEDFGSLVALHPALAGVLDSPPERREVLLEISDLDAEFEEARRSRGGAERMFAEAAISKARFEELHGPLERKVREIEGRLARLRAKLSKMPAGMAGSRQWSSLWASWPQNRRRKIMEAFVGSLIVGDGEIEITYLLPEPSAPKEAPEPQQISAPTNQTPAGGGPVYVRLPKPGERCPITGLSRAKLNELILPNERNGFSPPVASKSLRQRGAQRGIRLVLLESLMAHLSGPPAKKC